MVHSSSGQDSADALPAQDTRSYAQSFAQLERIAQHLSQQALVDIDQLLPMVDEAMSAYQFCQARISAVENLLNEKLKSLAS